MAKRPDPRRLRSAMTYTVAELARATNTTDRTVRAWLKNGLPAFTTQRPTLILGEDAKAFLVARRAAKEFSLAPDEVFCMSCKGPRKFFASMVDLIDEPGKPVRIQGFCDTCETVCCRVVSPSRIDDLSALFEITTNSVSAA